MTDKRVVITQEDTFITEMREQVETFYNQVEIDLFESEREEHRKIAKSEEKLAMWDYNHTLRFLEEIVGYGRARRMMKESGYV